MGKNLQIALQALAPILLNVAFSLGIPAAIFGLLAAILSGCYSPSEVNNAETISAGSVAMIENSLAQQDSGFTGEAVE